jgi:hypothetical protein
MNSSSTFPECLAPRVEYGDSCANLSACLHERPREKLKEVKAVNADKPKISTRCALYKLQGSNLYGTCGFLSCAAAIAGNDPVSSRPRYLDSSLGISLNKAILKPSNAAGSLEIRIGCFSMTTRHVAIRVAYPSSTAHGIPATIPTPRAICKN